VGVEELRLRLEFGEFRAGKWLCALPRIATVGEQRCEAQVEGP
jgi:hypothetical protein